MENSGKLISALTVIATLLQVVVCFVAVELKDKYVISQMVIILLATALYTYFKSSTK